MLVEHQLKLAAVDWHACRAIVHHFVNKLPTLGRYSVNSRSTGYFLHIFYSRSIYWLTLNFQSGDSWSLYWSILGRSLISTSLRHISTDSWPTMATVTWSYYQWTVSRHSVRLLVISWSTLGQYLGSHSVNTFLVNLRLSLGLYLGRYINRLSADTVGWYVWRSIVRW